MPIVIGRDSQGRATQRSPGGTQHLVDYDLLQAAAVGYGSASPKPKRSDVKLGSPSFSKTSGKRTVYNRRITEFVKRHANGTDKTPPRPPHRQQHQQQQQSMSQGTQDQPVEVESDSEAEGWYTIRRILDERQPRRRGRGKGAKKRKEYLVSWAANPKTGKEYPNTWVPAEDVTDEAIAQWDVKEEREEWYWRALSKAKDAELLAEAQRKSSTRRPGDPSPAPTDNNNSSQPVRSAPSRKRPRLDSISSSNSRNSALTEGATPAAKRPRLDRHASTISISSTEAPTEDASDILEHSSRDRSVVVVELEQKSYTDYETVEDDSQDTEPESAPLSQESQKLLLQSQSQSQQQSVSALEEEDARIVFPTLSSQRTIPDSQEQEASNSYPRSQGTSLHISDSQKDSSLSTSHLNRSVAGDIASAAQASESQIPSRQPHEVGEAAAAFSQSSSLNISSTSARHLSKGASQVPDEEDDNEKESSQPQFFTQVPHNQVFDNLTSTPAQSSQVIPPSFRPEAGKPSSDERIEVPRTDKASSETQQPAQIVPQLFPHPRSLVESIESSSSGQAIPDSVVRPGQANSSFRPVHRDPATSILLPEFGPSFSQSSESSESFYTPLRRSTSQLPRNSESPGNMSSSGTPRRSAVELMREAAEKAFASAESPSQDVSTTAQTSGPVASSHEPEASQPTITTDHNASVPSTTQSAETSAPISQAPAANSQPEAVAPEFVESTMTGTTDEAPAESSSTAFRPSIQINSEPPQETTPMNPSDMVHDREASYASESPFGQPPGLGPDLSGSQDPLLGPGSTDAMPPTVSPSEISRSIEPDHGFLPPLSIDDHDQGGMMGYEDMDLNEEPPGKSPPSSSEPQHPAIPAGSAETNEFVVTLQLPANTRTFYKDTMRSYRTEIEEFTKVMSEGWPVDSATVNKIDQLFGDLLNLCDYPASLGPDQLRQLSSAELKKHAMGTNSKHFFVARFLERLRASDTKVLIVVRSQELLGYLEAIVSSISDISYSKTGLEDIEPQHTTPSLSVVLVRTDQPVSKLADFDVIIGFDSGFRTCEVSKQLESYQGAKPMVLSLAITFSTEHLDIAIPRDLDELERKNAAVIALFQSRSYIYNYEGQFIDQTVADFALQVLEPDPDFIWHPEEIPAALLDFYTASQSQRPENREGTAGGSEEPTDRKRKLDEQEESSAKRVRHSNSPRSSGNIDESVHSQIAPATSQVQVTIAQAELDTLRSKNASLEERIKEKTELEYVMKKQIGRMSKQIASHERTTNDIQKRHMEALSERAQFEKQAQQATEAAKGVQTRLSEMQDKLSDTQARLEEVTAARAADDPVFASLTERTKELDAANEKVAELERRLRYKESDLEYARSTFQDERQATGEAVNENRDLRERVANLEQRLAQDLAKVASINADGTQKELARMLSEAKALVRDREVELERVREELKTLRNGRRETRGSSVPRSPRMGVMSPRTGPRPAPTGGNGGGGPVRSRGTSPVVNVNLAGVLEAQGGGPVGGPGSQFFNPSSGSNGRLSGRDFL